MTNPTFRYTLIIEYSADPSDYEGSDGDPNKMAEMDLKSVLDGNLSPYDLGTIITEKIEVVK